MNIRLLKSLWIPAIGAVLLSCGRSRSAPAELPLAEGWKVQSSAVAGQDGEKLSGYGAGTKDWFPAVVPSTVMGTLLRNRGGDGALPDGCGAESAASGDCLTAEKSGVGAEPARFDCGWWYRKEFALKKLRPEEHLFLELDGLSYRADIWLNGKLIAPKSEVAGPYRRFRFEITEEAGERNALAVEVFRARPGEPNIGFVDWNPRPPDESMGLFRGVRLKRCGPVSLRHSAVRTELNTDTYAEAELRVETRVSNLGSAPVKGSLIGTLEGRTFRKEVELGPKEERIVRIGAEEAECLHIRQPRLWWCRPLGSPELYRMDLRFETDGSVSDRETVDFGIRDIRDYFTEEGHRGFLLNGRKVLLRGAGWTDDRFLRNTPEGDETQIRYVCDMNLNSIRFENVWGTSRHLYDLCDRYGLLVLAGWSCQWEWEEYLGSECDDYGGIRTPEQMDVVAASFEDQVLWLRNHPSIAAWFVGSDRAPRPELEARYRKILAQYDGRPYLIAAKQADSPLSGPSGMKMEGPYEYVAPNYWYCREAPGGAFGFNTETGVGAQLPVLESLRKMMPEKELWPLSKAWDRYCTVSSTAMNGMEELLENMTARYGRPEGLGDFLRKADLMNYESTRAMFEAFRAHEDRATGIVQWMLNSAWPSLYWQLYDYYGIPTAAYYGVRKAGRPVQLVYDYGAEAVVAVNAGPEAEEIEAKIAVYDLEGRKLQEERCGLTAVPGRAVQAAGIGRPEAVALLFVTLTDKDGNAVDESSYCLSHSADEYDWAHSTWYQTSISRHADFTPLSAMKRAACGAALSREETPEGTVLQLRLDNRSGLPAFFLRLALADATDGNELLHPVFFSDNYFSLAPYGRRTIRCLVPKEVRRNRHAVLKLSGWNIEGEELEAF